MPSKVQILDACKAQVNAQIQLLRHSLQELSLSAESESKSTAGDKHETGRAMLQLEQEKIGNQLKEMEQRMQELMKVHAEQEYQHVTNGSLVTTAQGQFFIAGPIGKIHCDGVEIMVLSARSPFAQAILGKGKGKFMFNNKEQEILNVQ